VDAQDCRGNESALLGSLLLGADIPAGITESVFYDADYRRYFRVIKKLRGEGIEKPDIGMLFAQLKDWSDLKADDSPRIAELTDTVASAANIDFYADKIIEAYKIRQLERAIDSAQTAIKERRTADEIAEAFKKLLQVRLRNHAHFSALKIFRTIRKRSRTGLSLISSLPVLSGK
jgi:replicative DNA helicase